MSDDALGVRETAESEDARFRRQEVEALRAENKRLIGIIESMAAKSRELQSHIRQVLLDLLPQRGQQENIVSGDDCPGCGAIVGRPHVEGCKGP